MIQKDGSYRVENAPDKLYVGKGAQYICIADKDELKNTVFTLILQEKDSKILVIKRCTITSFTLSKLYTLVPTNGNFRILKFSTLPNAEIHLTFKSSRVKDKSVYFSDYLVKNPSSQGTILSRNEVAQIKFRKLDEGEVPPPKEPKKEDPKLF